LPELFEMKKIAYGFFFRPTALIGKLTVRVATGKN
jgi:hypothetical protein